MIEKSLYENYQIGFDDSVTPNSDDYLLIFNNERELYLDENKKLPKSLEGFNIDFCFYIGEYKGKKLFIATQS